MEEKKYKKFYRKADKHLNGKIEAKHGKRNNHKMKPYLVLQFLLKNTDENHTQSAYDIIEFLDEYGITADRRSIYNDIDEINMVNLAFEQDYTLEEAQAVLDADEYDKEKLILYDKHQKGFYIKQRHFDLDDIRLLAECVYSAKFVAEGQAKRLVDVVCEFVSEHQAERIKHNVFLTDRVKTTNKGVLNMISTINDAMSTKIDGTAHTPEKISFKYLKHTLDDINEQVERNHGERYIVSPFHLLINDGNYYLLAYDDIKCKMLTFRVDRMKDVKRAKMPREGEKVFNEFNLKSYAKRTFSMYGGEEKRIELEFIPSLLDTVIERFGTSSDVHYSKSGKRRYKVLTKVAVSPQFFGWLVGLGKNAQILYPEEVREQFAKYIDDIQMIYKDE